MQRSSSSTAPAALLHSLCTCSVSHCPHENVELRLRPPGIDLWWAAEEWDGPLSVRATCMDQPSKRLADSQLHQLRSCADSTCCFPNA